MDGSASWIWKAAQQTRLAENSQHSKMKITAILLSLPITLLAQDFEEAPTLSAAAILKPEFVTGVRDPVPTYGGRNGYMIDSDFGTFEADGNTMLMRRIREIAAIARLREVS